MTVLASSCLSSVKIYLNHGPDINGKNLIKTKTLNKVKSATTNDDIMAVVNALVALQQHSLEETLRVDNTQLSE